MGARRAAAAILVPAALALGGCGGAGAPSAASSAARPSFVVVIADDMAYGLIGPDRRVPFLSLPSLDALAARGVRFDRAFVTTSLCSPSRATMLTGLYAHSHHVLGNDGMDLPAGLDTYPRLLQRAGYETAFVGKWHMDPHNDMPRPGFDHWVSFRGQGVYDDPVLNVDGRTVSRAGYTTDILTEYAVEWLSARGGRPFLLILSHKAAHQPFEPPARHAAAFPEAALPEPASFADTFADKPEWQRRYVECGGTSAALETCPPPMPASLPPWPWSPRERWRLDYLRTLLGLDDSVGAVLAALEARHLDSNTYVVFISDNGMFLGEHRLADKRLAYEESIRVPFLMAGPGLAPRRVGALALNLDLAPTLLDLAGVAVPAAMQGRSLAGLARGEAGPPREAFLYEYARESLYPVVPSLFAIRTDALKYVTSPDDPTEEELYDLRADPGEMTDLADRPEWGAVKAALRERLERLRADTGG